MRIAGITIPDNKKIEIALTYIYGIGPNNVRKIIAVSKVDPAKRTKDLSEEEMGRVQKAVEKFKIEGDLRAEIFNDIKRLREIGSYRGMRHVKNLPVRGQRTRSNARTKRGKRVTIGAIRKEVAERMGITKGAAPAAAAK